MMERSFFLAYNVEGNKRANHRQDENAMIKDGRRYKVHVTEITDASGDNVSVVIHSLQPPCSVASDECEISARAKIHVQHSLFVECAKIISV